MGDLHPLYVTTLQSEPNQRLSPSVLAAYQAQLARFKHFAVARTLNRPELLEDTSTGQIQGILPLLPGGLLRRKSLFRFGLLGRGGGLLLLDRLAFPSSSHQSIIVTPRP